MTLREKEILNLIKINPLISQKEIADKLKITRSSVGVHITNLQKKGLVLGKGYIVREEDFVVVIGGSNIDIQGFSKEKMVFYDSNPGKTKLSLGGVARNIAENISKLNIKTNLITVVGDDVYGRKILEEAKFSGMQIDDSLVIPSLDTSTYLSMLDNNGDMLVALSSMEILDKLSIKHIKSKKHIIEKAKVIVVDTNIKEEVLDYITSNFNNPIFLDTVSTKKALKVKDFIGRFHTIKPNKIEAEILSGIKIKSDSDLKKASEYFLEKGVKNIFITLGAEGVYYHNKECSGKIKNAPIKVTNATGAGDAFVSALVYGFLNDLEIEHRVKFAMGASFMALSHENTINPNLSVENIENIMREVGLLC